MLKRMRLVVARVAVHVHRFIARDIRHWAYEILQHNVVNKNVSMPAPAIVQTNATIAAWSVEPHELTTNPFAKSIRSAEDSAAR